jgi:hypothetical protein
MQWEDMVHDVLGSDALCDRSAMSWVHGAMSSFIGLHELLRVLPDLGSVRPKREPQTNQVGL